MKNSIFKKRGSPGTEQLIKSPRCAEAFQVVCVVVDILVYVWIRTDIISRVYLW